MAGLKEMDLVVQQPLPHHFSLIGTGIGLGSLSLPDREDILRILHGEFTKHHSSPNNQWKSTVQEELGDLHEVHILETNLDDVRGEILGHLIPLLVSKGALDVSILSTITKKNRPGHLLRVVCAEKNIPQLTRTILFEAGTLGIRISRSTRLCVARQTIEKKILLLGKEFFVHFKVAKTPSGELIQVKAEFEDLKYISEELGIPIHEVERNLPRFKE
jgi:uncharacterized protein (DUF111 family)